MTNTDQILNMSTDPRKSKGLKQGLVRSDHDRLVYRDEHVEWGIHPADDDGVGYLVPKAGATPIPQSEWYD